MMDEDTFVVFLKKPIVDQRAADAFKDSYDMNVLYVDLDADENTYRQWLHNNDKQPVFGVCEGCVSQKGEEYISLYGPLTEDGCIKITWKSLPSIIDGLCVATTSVEEVKHEMVRMGTDIFDFM